MRLGVCSARGWPAVGSGCRSAICPQMAAHGSELDEQWCFRRCGTAVVRGPEPTPSIGFAAHIRAGSPASRQTPSLERPSAANKNERPPLPALGREGGDAFLGTAGRVATPGVATPGALQPATDRPQTDPETLDGPQIDVKPTQHQPTAWVAAITWAVGGDPMGCANPTGGGDPRGVGDRVGGGDPVGSGVPTGCGWQPVGGGDQLGVGDPTGRGNPTGCGDPERRRPGARRPSHRHQRLLPEDTPLELAEAGDVDGLDSCSVGFKPHPTSGAVTRVAVGGQLLDLGGQERIDGVGGRLLHALGLERDRDHITPQADNICFQRTPRGALGALRRRRLTAPTCAAAARLRARGLARGPGAPSRP